MHDFTMPQWAIDRVLQRRGKLHVHDLHATILNQLGLDHTKLTFRYSGRDMRLTDVYGNVVKEILA